MPQHSVEPDSASRVENLEAQIEARLSHLEASVSRNESITNDFTSRRRLCDSYISSRLEMLLLSDAVDSNLVNDEQLRTRNLLLQRLSDCLVDDAQPSLTLENTRLSTSIYEARAYIDSLLNSTRDEQDAYVDQGPASDAHCSLEKQEAVSELYYALSSCWPRCTPSHEAMLGLAVTQTRSRKRRTTKYGESDAVDLDVVLSTHCQKWIESQFSVSQVTMSRPIWVSDEIETPSVPGQPVNVCHLIESSATNMKYVRVGVSSRSLCSQQPMLGRPRFSAHQPRIPLSSLVASRVRQTENLSIASPILSKRHKAILSVILAYSFWHLSKDAWSEDSSNEGPLLHRKWNEDGFFFLATTQRTLATPQQSLNIGRPYLSMSFDYKNAVLANFMHPSPSIFTFAMILIGIQCFDMFAVLKSKILDKEREENPGLVTEPLNMDYMAAIQLIETSNFQDNVDGPYQRAIRSCLLGNFVENFRDMDELEIRARFFQNVIAPLKKGLKDSWNLTPNDLCGQFEVPIPGELWESKANETRSPFSPPSGLPKYMEPQSFSQISLEESISTREEVAFFTGTASFGPNDELCLFADEEDAYRPITSNDAVHADRWLEMVKKRVHPLIKAQKGQRRIKIAILDTGAQLPKAAEVAYEDQIGDHKSWLNGEEDKELSRGDRDLDGHGTHCASLLLKVGKNVSIYVARVFRKRAERIRPIETEATQERIAKAILHAVKEWQVDIITLSFGYNDRVESIHKAISEAYSRNVLVFVAASNCGGNDRIKWPARMDKVIAVHATNGQGNPTDFTPNPVTNGDNFAVLGRAVKSFWPEHLGGPEKRMDGTSCAAPILAGIAAIILDYVHRTKSRHTEFKEYEELFERIYERQNMSRILHKMVKKDTIGRGHYNYIEPWELLNAEDKHYNEGDVLRSILRGLN